MTTDTGWDGEDGRAAAVWGVDAGHVDVAVLRVFVDVDRSVQAVTRVS